jgi:hypothetical protein
MAKPVRNASSEATFSVRNVVRFELENVETRIGPQRAEKNWALQAAEKLWSRVGAPDFSPGKRVFKPA